MSLIKRTDTWIILALSAFLVYVTANQSLGVFTPTGQLEVAAVMFTGVCVWLAAKNNMWTWPIGIVGTILYFFLFMEWKLYADAGLQVVYTGLGFVGLWTWLYIRRDISLPEASHVRPKEALGVAAFIVAGTLVMHEILVEVNGSAPWIDAGLTAGSLGAQYLLIRKRIENWYVWAVLDVAYTVLFLTREFYLSAVLYAIFTVIVIRAAFEWRQYLPQPRLLDQDWVKRGIEEYEAGEVVRR